MLPAFWLKSDFPSNLLFSKQKSHLKGQSGFKMEPVGKKVGHGMSRADSLQVLLLPFSHIYEAKKTWVIQNLGGKLSSPE